MKEFYIRITTPTRGFSVVVEAEDAVGALNSEEVWGYLTQATSIQLEEVTGA